jgi:hypothetical protein
VARPPAGVVFYKLQLIWGTSAPPSRPTLVESERCGSRGRPETDESCQRYPFGPVPVEELDRQGVLCFVCLDEGCEWCPAVGAVEYEDAPEETPPPDAAAA